MFRNQFFGPHQVRGLESLRPGKLQRFEPELGEAAAAPDMDMHRLMSFIRIKVKHITFGSENFGHIIRRLAGDARPTVNYVAADFTAARSLRRWAMLLKNS